MKYVMVRVSRTEDNKFGNFEIVALAANRETALETLHDYRKQQTEFDNSDMGVFLGKITAKLPKAEYIYVIIEVSNYEIYSGKE